MFNKRRICWPKKGNLNFIKMHGTTIKKNKLNVQGGLQLLFSVACLYYEELLLLSLKKSPHSCRIWN